MLITLMKAANVLVPHDDAAAAFIQKLKLGELAQADYRIVRNVAFHKKYFALLNFAFDQWDAPSGLQYLGQPVTKNLHRFRKDVAILAGHFDSFVNLKGEVRLEAKSISFGRMNALEFEALYNSTIDVILARVLTRYKRADIDSVVEQLLRFT